MDLRYSSPREGLHCKSCALQHQSLAQKPLPYNVLGALRPPDRGACKPESHFRVHCSPDLETRVTWRLEFYPISRWGPFLEQQVCHPLNL